MIKSSGEIILYSDVHDEDLSDNINSLATIAYSNIPTQLDTKLSIWIYFISVLIGLLLLILSLIGFWMVI